MKQASLSARPEPGPGRAHPARLSARFPSAACPVCRHCLWFGACDCRPVGARAPVVSLPPKSARLHP